MKRVIRKNKIVKRKSKPDKRLIKTDKKDTKRTGFDPTKPKKKLDFAGWFTKFKTKIMPGSTYLVNMELRNGMHQYFAITTSKDHFIYKGAAYIIEDEAKYFCLSVNKFALDYHQDFSLPYKRKFPLGEVRKTINSMGAISTAAGNIEVETAINPSSLKNFIESNFIQKVMKGQELDDKLKQILIVSALSALASTVMVVLFVAKSGMLNSINIPGIGG